MYYFSLERKMARKLLRSMRRRFGLTPFHSKEDTGQWIMKSYSMSYGEEGMSLHVELEPLSQFYKRIKESREIISHAEALSNG